MMGHFTKKKSITTLNDDESGILCALKPGCQNAEIKLSKMLTHNFDASFFKTGKTGDGTKQF